MLPNQRWFPTNRTARAAWFNNFAVQFEKIAVSLGFTQADIDAVNADNEVVQFAARSMTSAKAYLKALQSFHFLITQGGIGDTEPQLPAAPNFIPPPMVATGIWERLERLRRRIKAAPAFTNETAAVLGMIPAQERSLSGQDTVPKMKAGGLTTGYRFQVAVTKHRTDGFQVQFSRNGSDIWENAAFGTASPLTVEVAPANPGQAEQILVRAQLYKANKPASVFSDPSYVTIVP
ncbi:MAG: hypothetical protein WKF92_01505 [Pyrinomonadaceae bacterium]